MDKNKSLNNRNERVLKGDFNYKDGKLSFTRHTQNVDFMEVREAITALRDECQRLLDNQTNCPFHKSTQTI